MAGTLYHSVEFDREEYIGLDGAVHYELVPIDGGMDVMSVRSWSELREYCKGKGVPPSAWPECISNVDVPLEDIKAQNTNVRPSLERLPAEVVAGMDWLNKVVGYVRCGELFFFSAE